VTGRTFGWCCLAIHSGRAIRVRGGHGQPGRSTSTREKSASTASWDVNKEADSTSTQTGIVVVQLTASSAELEACTHGWILVGRQQQVAVVAEQELSRAVPKYSELEQPDDPAWDSSGIGLGAVRCGEVRRVDHVPGCPVTAARMARSTTRSHTHPALPICCAVMMELAAAIFV
jgi:hypothetical protein